MVFPYRETDIDTTRLKDLTRSFRPTAAHADARPTRRLRQPTRPVGSRATHELTLGPWTAAGGIIVAWHPAEHTDSPRDYRELQSP